MQGVKFLTALDRVSTSQSSTSMWVGDFDRIAILLRGAAITSGNGVFRVRAGFAGSASDTPTMTLYNQLVDNLLTNNTQTQSHVNGKTISANGDAMVWMDVNTPATHINVDVTRTTDGTYSAYVIGFNNFE